MKALLFILFVISGCDDEVKDTGSELVDSDLDGVFSDVDCDDSNSSIYPGAKEICDGLDNDCDGFEDDPDPDLSDGKIWYQDYDGDTYGDLTQIKYSCADDTLDGFVKDSSDCDDNNASINPSADEYCNEVDDNCNEEIDENPVDPTIFYKDKDNDSYGDSDTAYEACFSNDVIVEGDCDDANSSIYPGAPELCDTIDNDCDSLVDDDDPDALTLIWYQDTDSDGYGLENVIAESCEKPNFYSSQFGDCDDTDSAINPDADEVCDGVDNNCDTFVDDDAIDRTLWYEDSDNDGFGSDSTEILVCEISKPSGYISIKGDCDDTNSAVNPGADEICDSLDNDCDLLVDDDDSDVFSTNIWYLDSDGDNFGDADATSSACIIPSGYSEFAGDCNDLDSTINPDATELCDLVDSDCDGSTYNKDTAGWETVLGVTDVSSSFTTSTTVSPSDYSITNSGTLYLCNGSFFTNFEITATDVDVIGLGSVTIDGLGGRIFDYTGTGTLSIENMTIINGNNAVTVDTGDLEIDNCSFTLNEASSSTAADKNGSVINMGSGNLTISDSEFKSNDADNKGAIYLDGTTAIILDSEFSGNTSYYGGAIYGTSAQITIQDTNFSSNGAENNGGAIHLVVSSDLDITNSFIENNFSLVNGGALYSSSSTVTITDTLFNANETLYNGGGINLSSSSLTCYSLDTTKEHGFLKNESEEYGGAVYMTNGSTVDSYDCDWGNEGKDNEPDDIYIVGHGSQSKGNNQTFSCSDAGC